MRPAGLIMQSKKNSKKLKEKLKLWNRDIFGDVRAGLYKVIEEIKKLDSLDEEGGLDKEGYNQKEGMHRGFLKNL